MPSSLQYPSAYSRSKLGWFSAAAAAQTSPCFSAPGKSAGMNLIAAFRGFGCATSVRNTALWSVLPRNRSSRYFLSITWPSYWLHALLSFMLHLGWEPSSYRQPEPAPLSAGLLPPDSLPGICSGNSLLAETSQAPGAGRLSPQFSPTNPSPINHFAVNPFAALSTIVLASPAAWSGASSKASFGPPARPLNP